MKLSLFHSRFTLFQATLFIVLFVTFAGTVVAWTGPSATAPSGNVDAPINVGSASQVKNGALGVNSLTVYGVSQFLGSTPLGSHPTYLQIGGTENSNIIQFPSVVSSNDNAFLYPVTSNNNYDLRLYLQDDQDDSEKFSIWGGSCQNGGCDQGTANSIEQFHVTAAGNGYFRGNVQANAFYYNSDRNLKHNIVQLSNGLDIVNKLQGVTFNWNGDNRADVGLIAQNVEKVLPQLVRTDPKTGLKSVEYANLVAPLIEAVKEQQKEIDALKQQVQDLSDQVKGNN